LLDWRGQRVDGYLQELCVFGSIGLLKLMLAMVVFVIGASVQN
jgi:hypothetical protein